MNKQLDIHDIFDNAFATKKRAEIIGSSGLLNITAKPCKHGQLFNVGQEVISVGTGSIKKGVTGIITDVLPMDNGYYRYKLHGCFERDTDIKAVS